MPSVTFETNCFEKDWEILLKTDRLENMIKRNNYNFTERLLYINNVPDVDKVKYFAEVKKNEGIITDYFVVDDFTAEVLDFFGLTRESLKSGYYYTIHMLVAIYRCNTDFLLHYTGDSILERNTDWIDAGINKLNEDPRIRVVNCLWNYDDKCASGEALEEDDDYWIGHGFSDQSYLIRVNDFKTRIYNEYHPLSEKNFPTYVTEQFEKKVDAWMRNHEYLRATYKHGCYISKSYPRNRIIRDLKRVFRLYNGA